MNSDTILTSIKGKQNDAAGLIERYCRDNHLIPVKSDTDLLPPELLAAGGVYFCYDPFDQLPDEIFQYRVRGGPCGDNATAVKEGEYISLTVPCGYGETLVAPLLGAAASLLKEVLDEPEISRHELQQYAAEFNTMRYGMRGIFAAKRKWPDVIPASTVAALIEAAAFLPPELITEELLSMAQLLRNEGETESDAVPVMVVAGEKIEDSLLDEIESAGFAVVEDDLPMGRRLFDTSFNHESPRLVEDILHSWSYRAYNWKVRSLHERDELVYSQLTSMRLEGAILIQDYLSEGQRAQYAAIRHMLMIRGIDPVEVTSDTCGIALRRYHSSAYATLHVDVSS